MKARIVGLLLLLFLVSGCWDRMELEDQLFFVTLGIDKGEVHRYRISARTPVTAAIKTGMLGGQPQAGRGSEILVVEADSVAQGVYMANASATRRITLRHLRAVLVGETLAREGIGDLLSELARNPEVRGTAAFLVVRGKAAESLEVARFPGETNPGKLSEGIQLVEKHLHMGPPVRLHHMLSRGPKLGVSAFAPVDGVNRRILAGKGELAGKASAVAGELDRVAGNPVEIAGTALFDGDSLVGYLTVDETQALLALRGEMGKAYMTVPSPFAEGKTLILRFQQENKPVYRATITPDGPRITGRILFEGELLSGAQDYWDERNRRRVEEAARTHMVRQIESVLAKCREWGTDPVGFGLLFRGKFPTWDDWDRYDWTNKQLPRLKVSLSCDMRIRRFGMTLGPLRSREH